MCCSPMTTFSIAFRKDVYRVQKSILSGKKMSEVGRVDFQSVFTNRNLRLSEDEEKVRECFVVVAEG